MNEVARSLVVGVVAVDFFSVCAQAGCNLCMDVRCDGRVPADQQHRCLAENNGGNKSSHAGADGRGRYAGSLRRCSGWSCPAPENPAKALALRCDTPVANESARELTFRADQLLSLQH